MIDLKRLKESVRYDPKTGEFTWLINRGKGRTSALAGTMQVDSGYRIIRIDNVNYRAHRLAWLWKYGALPAGNIDHRDGNRANNRIANLRIGNKSQNAMNAKRPSTNTTGFKGVSFDKRRNKYNATIKKDQRAKYLGAFNTAEEAHAAYKAKASELFGEYARFE